MGFVFKSVFWLGLVYYAMPLGESPTLDAAPVAAALLCSSADAPLPEHLKSMQTAYRAAATTGCAAALGAMATNPVAFKSAAAVNPPVIAPRPSAHSLVSADRQTPWFGRQGSTSSGMRPKQS